MTANRWRTALYVGIALAGIGAALAFLTGSEKSSGDKADPTDAQLRLVITESGIEIEDDKLGLGNRVVFSTAAYKAREDQGISLRNETASDIRIKSLKLEGPSPQGFALGEGQSASSRIPANDTASVRLRFTPKRVGIVNAKLNIELDRGAPISVALGGYNAEDFEGGFEPNLQEIFDALGYSVNVAMPESPPPGVTVPEEDRGNAISTSSDPVGEEIRAPYFKQADPGKAAQLIPVAAYVSRSTSPLGPFGIFVPGDKTKTQQILSMVGGGDDWGGENQQLLPGLGNGSFDALTPGSSINFKPTGELQTFGVWDGTRDNFSDDALNAPNATTGKGEHIFRVYPAKTRDLRPIPNTYLVALDSGSPDYRNYDYQDFVFLLKNVVPA